MYVCIHKWQHPQRSAFSAWSGVQTFHNCLEIIICLNITRERDAVRCHPPTVRAPGAWLRQPGRGQRFPAALPNQQVREAGQAARHARLRRGDGERRHVDHVDGGHRGPLGHADGGGAGGVRGGGVRAAAAGAVLLAHRVNSLVLACYSRNGISSSIDRPTATPLAPRCEASTRACTG